MTRFKYSADQLDRKLYKGRTVPAIIIKGEEQVKETTEGPIPSIILHYETPSRDVEMQRYEGAVDSIPAHSTLGRLISNFDSLGIADIGRDAFAPLIGLAVQLRIEASKNGTGGVTYIRYPIKMLSEEEHKELFGKPILLSNLLPHIDIIEAKLNNTPSDQILIRMLSITDIGGVPDDIEEAYKEERLVPWIEQNTRLRLEGSILVIQEKVTNNG